MSHQTPSLGIILPCYNEEEILVQTDKKVGDLIFELITEKLISPSSYIVYVDDGSRDKTWTIIQQTIQEKENRIGIKLSKNFGHQSALLAGMTNLYEKVDCIVTIDADLQDDIASIRRMIIKYYEGFDIVYGVRQKRETDTFFKRKTATVFYLLMKKMGVDIIYNHADFRLTDKVVNEKLLEFRESNLFLRGIFPIIGFNQTSVYYDRLERTAGETKYPFKKMLMFALEGITSFSVVPLRLVSLLGFIIFFFSLILAGYSLISYFYFGTVPGWTSITLPIYFIGGVQILCIGIIGEYMGKIYKEVKARPRFIIDTILWDNKKSTSSL